VGIGVGVGNGVGDGAGVAVGAGEGKEKTTGVGVNTGVGMASGQPAPGREFTLEVKLEPRGPGISGVQFRLHFPQDWVEVLDIVPGNLLGPAPLEVKQPKEEPGGFLYAAARRGKTTQNTPPGQVAVVRMRVTEDAPPGITLRAWLREVLIADHNMLRIEDVTVGQPLDLLVATVP